MSPNTVRKYVTQLEDKRLIETLPTTVWMLDGTARNGTLLYTILPIHEAVKLPSGAAVGRTADEKRVGEQRKFSVDSLNTEKKMERACHVKNRRHAETAAHHRRDQETIHLISPWFLPI